MTGETNLVAAAERRAIDGGNERLTGGFNFAKQQRQPSSTLHGLGRVIDAAQRVEIRTNDELGPRRRDDNPLDLLIGDDPSDRRFKRRNRRVVQDIHGTIGDIPDDGRDAVVDAEVNHWTLPNMVLRKLIRCARRSWRFPFPRPPTKAQPPWANSAPRPRRSAAPRTTPPRPPAGAP